MAIHHDSHVDSSIPVHESMDTPGAKKQRVLQALSWDRNQIPRVNGENLLRYYHYLREHLTFPFRARYADSPSDAGQPCTVLRLLAPTQQESNPLDGLLCETRVGIRTVTLPLVELETDTSSPNFQLLEDYWYWLWNWR